jgi:hypothetical protein
MFFGQVNVIAPVLSNFMLLCFASLNLAAGVLDISHTPNYRPQFKCNWKVLWEGRYRDRGWSTNHAPWQISLVGLALCLACMVMLDWIKALASIAFGVIAFIVFVR